MSLEPSLAPTMPLFSKRSSPFTCPARAVSRTTYNDSDDTRDYPDDTLSDYPDGALSDYPNGTLSDYPDGNPNVRTSAPPIETLLANHLRFAQAFRTNDAARILRFLAKDVALVAMDGARHAGQSAVLAWLVGARMTKLSANLRVKGFPTRSGARQSTFVYEHGIVFKDPLYMEVLEWKPDGRSVERIAHVPLLAASKKRKTPQRLSQGARRSSLDDRDELLLGGATEEDREDDDEDVVDFESSRGSESSRKAQCPRRLKSSTDSCSTGTAATLRLSSCSNNSSSSSSSSQSGAQEAAVQPLAGAVAAPAPTGSCCRGMLSEIELVEISCADLAPVRKRKTVNPYVTLQCPDTKTVWKSPVLRREVNPTWRHIPLLIPMHSYAAVVEIALWDHSFFRSVKVAGAALVESDILKDEAEFTATVQLERYDAGRTGADPQYVTMKFRFVRRYRGDKAARSSDEVEPSHGRCDEAAGPRKMERQTSAGGSVLDKSLKWLEVHPQLNGHHAGGLVLLFPAAVFAAIVWMLFHATLMWEKQVL